jgi:hypothetical protein
LANDVALDAVSDFRIADLGNGKLIAESKSPWVLKWTPNETKE